MAYRKLTSMANVIQGIEQMSSKDETGVTKVTYQIVRALSSFRFLCADHNSLFSPGCRPSAQD